MATIATATAQKQFTLEDLNYGGKNAYKFIPETRYLTWWGDELIRQDAEQCSKIDKQTTKETAILDLDEVNSIIGATTQHDSIHSFYYAEFPYADQPLVLLSNSQKRYLIDFEKKTTVWSQQCDGETHAEWNPQSKAVAFVKDDQLYVRHSDGSLQQLSTDGSHDIVYGQSVHRDEFGISKGTFWSADGQRLAFYRMDQSMVPDYPLVTIDTREAELEPTKYPMAGEKSHKVTVGIYDLKTKTTTYLKAGDPTDRYFTNIAWAPDGKTIYMIELNRDQTDMELVSYDPATGDRLKTLYKEHHDKYVHPMHPIVFLPWDDSKFLLRSEKDGYDHLYLFNNKGEQLKQLTKGEWVVMDVLGFNEKTKSVIISSREKSPIQINHFAVNVKSGKRTLLDNGRGLHYGTLSGSGAWIADNYSEPDVPRKIDIEPTNGGKTTNLLTAADPWEGYNQPEFSIGTLKAADGKTDLYYRMVKPIGFDATKKYPTIVYVYGGPGLRNVEAAWHCWSRSWETYMAQKGYLLFILDNRGSCDRGREFEQATFRHLGQEEMRDQMKGVEFLKSLPYVDQERMGVHGWSYGGYMTTSLMTNYPDVFKVGVAGGPVIDWKYYEVMYGERYMDTPQANPEGYAQCSLLNKADKLKGKLQIIIGMNDPVVVPQHALSFLKACIAAGTQPDFFVYPGEPHNMRGHQSVHLHERITQYFEDYLK